MTTATKTTYKSVEAAIRGEFPGKSNAGLRQKLRGKAADGIAVTCFSRSIALTAFGTAGLAEVERAQLQYDARLSR